MTVLVVNEKTGLPGEALMGSAKREYGDALDFLAMQSRVFVYDWFKDPAPKVEDLKRIERESARRLARLGGTAPRIKQIPRRRTV